MVIYNHFGEAIDRIPDLTAFGKQRLTSSSPTPATVSPEVRLSVRVNVFGFVALYVAVACDICIRRRSDSMMRMQARGTNSAKAAFA